MATYNQSAVFNGLGTFTVITPIAGNYFVEGKISLPTLSTGATANSAVVTTINQNGSPVYTGTAGAEGFRTDIAAAANDTIAVVFSSAAAVDKALNVIKATIQIGQGQ